MEEVHDLNNDADDDETIAMGVQALDEAQQKALLSSQPLVFSKNGCLWRRNADGQVSFIKKLRPPTKVSKGTKRVKR